MPLDISEVPNDKFKDTKPVKESMDKYIPDIVEGISRRNGMIYLMIGSGGSGKTSLLLNQFRKGGSYHRKFHHLYLFTPAISFQSVVKHPFEKHDKVINELTRDNLQELYDELKSRKEDREEDDDMEYNCVIIDDMANSLKEKDVQRLLNTMLIKARHLNVCFIFTLQSYLYMPKMLRKQTTFATIFKPKNREEWDVLNKELIQMRDEDARQLFEYVYDKEYAHLDIDTIEGKMYRNFNELTIKKPGDI